MLTFRSSAKSHARSLWQALRLKQYDKLISNGNLKIKTFERRSLHLSRTQLFPAERRGVHRNSPREANCLAPSDAQRKTIYALATPSGKGGVAVIRVSGPEALSVYHRIIRPWTKGAAAKEKVTPPSRKMLRCSVYDPVTGEDIDDGLAVFFPGMLVLLNTALCSLLKPPYLLFSAELIHYGRRS